MKTSSYYAGFEAVKSDIKDMGFKSALSKFNMDNPRNHRPTTMDAFHYATGGMDALVEHKNRVS